MKYVVDSSVGFKWFVTEADTLKALLLRDDFGNGLCELLAPDLFPTELANILLMEEQKKVSRIGAGDAALFLAQALTALPKLFQAVALLPRAQDIAKAYKQTVYDCLIYRGEKKRRRRPDPNHADERISAVHVGPLIPLTENRSTNRPRGRTAHTAGPSMTIFAHNGKFTIKMRTGQHRTFPMRTRPKNAGLCGWVPVDR